MSTPTPPSLTPETDELIDGMAAVGAAVHKAYVDDGKISIWEALTEILPQWPKVSDAVKGIAAVPAEILHASEDAHRLIADRIVIRLGDFGVAHRVRDVAEEIATALLFNLRTSVRIREILSVPVAEPVQE